MRIILRFGGFHQEIKVADNKAFQPIMIPHPQGRTAFRLTETGTIAEDNLVTLKRMRFEYARQLEHDLLEYEFAGEQ